MVVALDVYLRANSAPMYAHSAKLAPAARDNRASQAVIRISRILDSRTVNVKVEGPV